MVWECVEVSDMGGRDGGGMARIAKMAKMARMARIARDDGGDVWSLYGACTERSKRVWRLVL